jgi:indolepyruvate ferredoxin oxidoreductase alpha subunit
LNQENKQKAEMMLGNAAIARGAYEAGVKVSAAYPGTPSTEISETIVQYKDVLYSEWSPNEKVAMEVAIGASQSGVRALVSMKHVGVNVASDPLYTVSYIGVNGGLVLVAADDPGIYSSQNEQDSRMVARAAMVPVLEPSDSEEARVFTKRAFELSEQYDTPIMVRITTRLAHSQGFVNMEARADIPDKPYQRDFVKNVMMPGNAIKRHIYVEERQKKLALDANALDLNQVEYRDSKIGIITSGIPYQYVKEALPNASILKLGLVNPLPRKLIEAFAAKVEQLYIVEELEPVIEEQVKSWGIAAVGKEIFTIQGEYSTKMLKEKILLTAAAISDTPETVPARPPILCPGCPHRSVYSVLKKLKLHVAGDIGCYTLGAVAPLNVVDTCVCMGASISTLHGMEKAKGREYIKDWVAAIGDSTFLHTGVNSLMNMVYNNATGTVIIMDNSTTGMTGHQEHAATGKTLLGEDTNMVDLVALCKALGVKHVAVVDAFQIEELEQVVKTELARAEVSVIIAKSPCALLKDYIPQGKCKVDQEKCKKCGICMVSGCPAMRKTAAKTVAIDEGMCNGCGLCMSSCNFGAISLAQK